MQQRTFHQVSVVGLGYIGLPTAATLASHGVSVIGIDVNADAVDRINQGRAHFFEPELDVMVRSGVATGKLRAATTPEPADVFMIAVPTPVGAEAAPDLSYVEAAVRSLVPVLKRGDLVAIESTSPVGTTERMAALLQDLRPDLRLPTPGGGPCDVHMAYCPERILPGRMLPELVENDRVIGGVTPECARRALALYQTFVRGQCVLTSARAAEMVKLVENAYRDVNIAFANELSLLCDRFGLDVWEVIDLANHHPRVAILKPGPGVGGHCIAVDPYFLVHGAPDEARLISTARAVNDHKPIYVLGRIDGILAGLDDPAIAVLGLAYKANVDDLRESPALAIAANLAQKGYRLYVVEPNVTTLPAVLAGRPAVVLTDLDAALEAADLVVLLVDHREFSAVEPERLVGKKVYDTRGIWPAFRGPAR